MERATNRVFGVDLLLCVVQLGLRARDEKQLEAPSGQVEGVRLSDSIRRTGHNYSNPI